jgi:PIN domain nuclease of toxin-antitoxin system
VAGERRPLVETSTRRAASGWEIATKHRRGKLTIGPWNPSELPVLLERSRIDVLPVLLTHAIDAGSIAGNHHDPFDRLLMAQSRIEGMPIVSADPVFAEHGVEVIW